MKMRLIQVRVGSKDYVDIHTLISHAIDVLTGLAALHAARSEPVDVNGPFLLVFVEQTSAFGSTR
jgi:hypothetical protein